MKLKFSRNVNFKCKKKSKYKYLFSFLILLILMLVLDKFFINNTYATNSSTEVEDQLNESVDEQLNSVDFSGYDNILNQLEGNFYGKNLSFKEIVKGILNGNYYSDYGSLLKTILSLLFNKIIEYVPLLLIIVAVSLLTQLLINFKGEKFDSGIVNVVNIMSLIVVVVIVVSIFKNIFESAFTTINLMEKQSEILFPILLTFLTSMGSVVSVGIYKPVVAVLSTIITFVFTNFIYPIFIFAFVIAVLNRLSTSFKLSKLFNFINSLFKWVVGFIFTIFSAMLTIQGISAGKFDQISFKTTRFAIKSYVPIVGGYLSDGFDLVVLSSVLIKNSIGLAGIFIIISTILSPLITIIVLKLLFQLISSIVDILGHSKIAELLEDCSKLLLYPIVIILCVAFMYFISIGLIVCTSNIL